MGHNTANKYYTNENTFCQIRYLWFSPLCQPHFRKQARHAII